MDARPVKLLFLGNSNDIPRYKGNPTRASAVATSLEAASGQPVELVIKPIWPDEHLPARIARWMREEQPDLVFFSVPGFWFLYESVPLKLKRRWGPPGRWLASLGFATADKPHLAYNNVFRAFRTVLLRTIGGEAYIEPAPLMSLIEDCLREILRAEDVGAAMDGPNPTGVWWRAKHHKEWRDARLAYMTDAIARLCADLHVPVVELPPPGYLEAVPLEVDGSHRTGEPFDRMINVCTDALMRAMDRSALPAGPGTVSA